METYFVDTDGGRTAEHFKHEKNDCTVRALSVVTGKPYAVCHAVLKQFGRKDKRGFSIEPFLMAHPLILNCQFYKREAPPPGERSIRQFVFRHPAGKFLVRIRCHAFAVIDGKVYDKGGTRWKAPVKSFFEVDHIPAESTTKEA